MSHAINTQINTGLLTFTFTDSQSGEVISSFLLNPTDINIAARAEEVSAYFEKRAHEVKNFASITEAAAYNKEIEAKIDYLLGYEASKTVFKFPLTATTILPDGTLFAVVVIERILAAIKPEVEKRQKQMLQTVDKYTEKYESDPSAGLAPGQKV